MSPSVDIFVAVVTSATEVGNTRPSGSTPESVARIHEVCFYSLTSPAWDDFLAPVDPNLNRPDNLETRDVTSSTPPLAPVHPCLPLTKLLASGSFYYSLNPNWDISSRLAVRLSRQRSTRDVEAFDDRFVWNEQIIRGLLDFRERLDPDERADLDACQFLVRFLHPLSIGGPTQSEVSRYSQSKASSEFLPWLCLHPPPMVPLRLQHCP